VCALRINTPASGLAKVRQLRPIFLLLFCVLRRPTLASLLCRNRLSELLFSRLVFDFTSLPRRRLSSRFRYLRLLPPSPSPSPPLPSSPSPSPSPPPPSHLRHHLLHQRHQHLPRRRHRSPPLIFTIILHYHRTSSTSQDPSQHRCQYIDIYASLVFIIRTFSLVGDVASGPILSLSSLGTFLNSHVDADSTLHLSCCVCVDTHHSCATVVRKGGTTAVPARWTYKSADTSGCISCAS